MKVPVKWLKDYVNIKNISAKELGDLLTLSGSKMEEVITTGDEIQNVVTGKILKIEPHPDAEKLVVCQVEVGQESPIQIVTGADNMKEKDIVPVALHGSSLPGGVKIKKGKLRGILSNGMMCSEEELGIPVENSIHGLMILPQDTPIGDRARAGLLRSRGRQRRARQRPLRHLHQPGAAQGHAWKAGRGTLAGDRTQAVG